MRSRREALAAPRTRSSSTTLSVTASAGKPRIGKAPPGRKRITVMEAPGAASMAIQSLRIPEIQAFRNETDRERSPRSNSRFGVSVRSTTISTAPSGRSFSRECAGR